MSTITCLLSLLLAACAVSPPTEATAHQALIACDPDCDDYFSGIATGMSSDFVDSFFPGWNVDQSCNTLVSPIPGGVHQAWCDMQLTQNGTSVRASCGVTYYANGRVVGQGCNTY